MSRTDTDEPPPWHLDVYDEVDHWTDEKLENTYERLSRDLRIGGRGDMQHYDAMCRVEEEMRKPHRDCDPDEIARRVQDDARQL